MSRNLLIIAYHFPPIQGSSGVHRTLGFARYLPASGWNVSILTVNPAAYEQVRTENMALVPPQTKVSRAIAFDARRHFSLWGKYPRLLALPDRWQSWILSGAAKGWLMIRKSRPDVIMSTYPIASAHAIGYLLHKTTRVPWIADFRDPMLQANLPVGQAQRRAFDWVERRVFSNATGITVTTSGCRDLYLGRYPDLSGDRIRVIPNGYDEEAFSDIENHATAGPVARPLRLLHSGLLYQNDRNPDKFFRAMAELMREGKIDGSTVHVTLRASGHEQSYETQIGKYGLDQVVKLEPSIGYKSALAEMLSVDGLLIFQAASCNHQIPAKIYEYLYARKPILGLTDLQGDTGQLLQGLGIQHMAALDDTASIKAGLMNFIQAIKSESVQLPDKTVIENLSRRARTKELAQLLDELVGS